MGKTSGRFVYVADKCYPYEGTDVIGVFATLKGARVAVNKHNGADVMVHRDGRKFVWNGFAKNKYDGYNITRTRVGG